MSHITGRVIKMNNMHYLFSQSSEGIGGYNLNAVRR